MHTVYLSLGTNMGQRRRRIAKAVRLLSEQVGEVVRQSQLYETEPWGFVSKHKFINAAVCLTTTLSPHELLTVTQDIERQMGRRRKSVGGNYSDREIDIDILLYDDLHIDTPTLTIPHPLMYEREFVMKPLNEILT